MNHECSASNGPGVTRERYDWLNKVKFSRNLTIEEMEDYLSWKYFQNFGYWPDLSNPLTYNEKLNWLKIHYHNSKMHGIVDKEKFPSFVLTKFPEYKAHCVTPLKIFRSPAEMTNDIIDILPKHFILKSNIGSGAQKFVEKKFASLGQLKDQIRHWLNPRANHYFVALEWGYKDVPPAIICEPIIVFDYKLEFYCFGGEPVFYWIVRNDKTKDVHANLYDMDGQKLPVSWHYPNFDELVNRPDYFDELVRISKILATGFPHVRVDFYAAQETWYFSEMTFYTWAGLMPFSDPTFDRALGDKIKLESICV